MTDERDKPSRGNESLARTTARDVPYARDAGSDAEPAPRGQRPQQLPRDPTYEAELAQVELAVLRDPERRDDPSTKQGGRRGHQLVDGQPPESVTPESPGTRANGDGAARSPRPPSSGGRSVASGTLLSVGAVDPRGKTERTLETPRMFFSPVDASGQAYFKPGKIPAVTVHQTLETETVKLADSIDPRRAKTLPRIDRSALRRFATNEPESAAPLVLQGVGSSLDLGREDSMPGWNQDEYEPASSLGQNDGQIHASLSPFRDHAEPSFALDGAPTRIEPLAGRRSSGPPPSSELPAPDQSVIPTQRDLPAHRIEASLPPPPPVPSLTSMASLSEPSPSPVSVHAAAASESPVASELEVFLPQRRPFWVSLAAFALALLVTIVLGLWLTKSPATTPSAAPSVAPVRGPVASALAVDAVEQVPPLTEAASPPPPASATAAPHRAKSAAPKAPTTSVPAPKVAPAKPLRETIF